LKGLVLLGLIASASAYSCQPLYGYAPTPMYSNTSGYYYTGIYYDPLFNTPYSINSLTWPVSTPLGIWCAGCVNLTSGVTYNTTAGSINTYGSTPISASTWTVANDGTSTCSKLSVGACYTVPSGQQGLFCASPFTTACQFYYAFSTVPKSSSPAATSGTFFSTSWASVITASSNQIYCSDAPSLATFGLASVVTIIMALFAM